MKYLISLIFLMLFSQMSQANILINLHNKTNENFDFLIKRAPEGVVLIPRNFPPLETSKVRVISSRNGEAKGIFTHYASSKYLLIVAYEQKGTDSYVEVTYCIEDDCFDEQLKNKTNVYDIDLKEIS